MTNRTAPNYSTWSDEDLLRAATTDRKQYLPEMAALVDRELVSRGIALGTLDRPEDAAESDEPGSPSPAISALASLLTPRALLNGLIPVVVIAAFLGVITAPPDVSRLDSAVRAVVIFAPGCLAVQAALMGGFDRAVAAGLLIGVWSGLMFCISLVAGVEFPWRKTATLDQGLAAGTVLLWSALVWFLGLMLGRGLRSFRR